MLLPDTSVLVWFWHGNPRLGADARRAVERAWRNGEAAVSVFSFWEVGMLHEKGRLELPIVLPEWRARLLDEGLVEIPVDGTIATRAGLLPNMHGDPADRIIIATALEGHQLVTTDRRILNWPGALDRIDARR